MSKVFKPGFIDPFQIIVTARKIKTQANNNISGEKRHSGSGISFNSVQNSSKKWKFVEKLSEIMRIHKKEDHSIQEERKSLILTAEYFDYSKKIMRYVLDPQGNGCWNESLLITGDDMILISYLKGMEIDPDFAYEIVHNPKSPFYKQVLIILSFFHFFLQISQKKYGE